MYPLISVILRVPDEWATTKCSIVHKLCSNHRNEINNIFDLTQVGQKSVKNLGSFLGNGVSRKIAFEIY